MSFAIKAVVTSDSLTAALRRLNGLKPGRRNAILRTATTKSTRIIAKAAKGNLSARRKTQKKEGIARLGLLQKSIGIKVKVYNNAVVGLVGPRKGFKQQVGVRKKGGAKSKTGDPIHHDPANIAHLVELGHGGPHPAPAYPFLRPAFENNKKQVERIFIDEVATGMRKLAAQGKV
jgi:HK97 gp10 family phage protein